MHRVPGHTYLHRRMQDGGSYYFIRRIPTALLPAFHKNGKQQHFIKRALGTADLKQARKLIDRVAAEVQARFDEIEEQTRARRASQPASMTMSQDQLRAMVARWLHEVDSKSETAQHGSFDDETREQLIASCDEEEAALHDESGAAHVSHIVQDILDANGVPANRRIEWKGIVPKAKAAHRPFSDLPNDTWATLHEVVHRALIELVRRDRERLTGHNLFRAFDPLFADVNPREAAPSSPHTEGATFDKMIEAWKADRKPPARTAYEFERALNRLAAHVGHSDPRRVAKSDVVGWKASLLKQGKSAKTVFNQIAAVRALYGWAVRNEMASINPASGVNVATKGKPGERRRLPYTHDDAALILSAARNLEGSRKWVPWLLAFTGARLEEICQSHASDIRCESGVHYLDINADEGKSLKNAGSARRVPLHPALVHEGFLSYVEELPKNGPLFLDLSPDRFGKRGGNLTKVLGRWVRSLGISDKRKAPNHSWRHRFKDLCRAAGIQKSVHDALTGHASGDVGDGYGLGYPLTVLAEAVAKLPDQCPLAGARASTDRALQWEG